MITYLWFFAIPVIFLLIVLYVFRPGARRKYRRDAEIPFEDDKEHRD